MLSSLQRGRCPNCDATTVFTDTELSQIVKFFGEGYTNELPIARGFFTPQRAILTNYVCTSCGYTERYILDREALATIQQNWTSVNPA